MPVAVLFWNPWCVIHMKYAQVLNSTMKEQAKKNQNFGDEFKLRSYIVD